MPTAGIDDILNFWFVELSPADWWKKSDKIDERIRSQFSNIHQQAAACELFKWRKTPQGRLAEIVVLDQFSRNIYRDSPQAFACDALALALAQEGLGLGCDQALPANQRAFFYLPYMHSESAIIHELALPLFQQPGLEDNLKAEIAHKKIIDRFGRYPHRNTILGRESTQEELNFLTQPNSSF